MSFFFPVPLVVFGELEPLEGRDGGGIYGLFLATTAEKGRAVDTASLSLTLCPLRCLSIGSCVGTRCPAGPPGCQRALCAGTGRERESQEDSANSSAQHKHTHTHLTRFPSIDLGLCYQQDQIHPFTGLTGANLQQHQRSLSSLKVAFSDLTRVNKT